jgi:hypothetical protein
MANPPRLTEQTLLQVYLQLPWFEHLGQPNERDGEVRRITSWDEWPGGDAPGVTAYFYQAGEWRKGLLDEAGDHRSEIEAQWKRIEQKVLTHVASRVAYKPGRDTYYGPNLAAHDAAFMVSLVACHCMLGLHLPAELECIWWWYQAGHWPCGYTEGTELFEPSGLLIVY